MKRPMVRRLKRIQPGKNWEEMKKRERTIRDYYKDVHKQGKQERKKEEKMGNWLEINLSKDTFYFERDRKHFVRRKDAESFLVYKYGASEEEAKRIIDQGAPYGGFNLDGLKEERKEEQMATKVAKKGTKKQVRKPEKTKVEVKGNTDSLNPFKEGTGVFIAFSELEKGGKLDDIVKRTVARFRKEKPASTCPGGRVTRVLAAIKGGWEKKLSKVKLQEAKNGEVRIVAK